uniref:Uncharacterized protein n=1 Tax=Heterorhabditis bacteriophora TaxID=37862 RepID=A0A1I7XMF0_HETBA
MSKDVIWIGVVTDDLERECSSTGERRHTVRQRRDITADGELSETENQPAISWRKHDSRYKHVTKKSCARECAGIET